MLHEGANAPNGTFSTLRFGTVRERERRDCLVAKTIYFNITKLLRPGNISSKVRQGPPGIHPES